MTTLLKTEHTDISRDSLPRENSRDRENDIRVLQAEIIHLCLRDQLWECLTDIESENPARRCAAAVLYARIRSEMGP